MLMKKLKTAILVLILSIGIQTLLHAASIAVVDTREVLTRYSKARQVMEDIAKAEKHLRDKFRTKRQKVQDARKSNKTETEIKMLTEQIKSELEPEAKKLEAESTKKSAEVEKSVKASIERIKKQNKYQIVILKDAVLFGGDDITEQVIKDLEAK